MAVPDIAGTKGGMKSQAVADLPIGARGRPIIAPRRNNSAHLHRPWCANQPLGPFRTHGLRFIPTT